ncbi:MAG: LemA family protein [Pyrinomonadaceae bacterium]
MRKLAFVFLMVVVGLGFSGCSYNEMTAKQQNVKGSWADVETQLQRRADLIPNLVKAAQTAGVQEQEVFGKIAEARSTLLNAVKAAPAGDEAGKTPEQKQAILEANNSFGGTIGRLLALQENYPVLKSNENFLKLQDELTGTENRIATSRSDYNKVVTDYNTTINQFPAVITAKLVGFKEEPFFKADEASRAAPSLPDPNSIREKAAPAAK